MEPYSSDDIKRKKRRNGYGLNKLLRSIPEISSVLIVTAEGLPIAHALPQGVDETRIAAMTSTLLSLSERAIIEIGKGDFDQLYIKGREGYFIVMQAGPNAVVALSTTKEARLGLILLDCRKMCEKIAKMGTDFDDDDGDDYLPYPYIFKPPEPPGDLNMQVQLQMNKFMDKEPENEKVCQYCGRKLTDEESFSHNCRKSPE